MSLKRTKHLIISILLLLFIGAGLQKTYAGSVLLSTRISLHVQKETLEKVLSIIEKNANIQFMYNPNILNINRVLSIQMEKATLKEVLQSVINNKEIVFYEMGNIIVITTKQKAKDRKDIIPAYDSQNETTLNSKNISIKSVVFYDTLKTIYIDTNKISLIDTIKIFDTIRVLSNVPKLYPKTPEKATPIKLKPFVDASFMPMYATILPDGKWKSNLSLSGQLEIGVKRNNVQFSIGIGTIWHRGSSVQTVQSKTIDSVLHTDTLNQMEKYIVGDFYSVKSKDTIRTLIYDSSIVAIPRKWYNTSEQTTINHVIVNYSILWITIPIKVSYEWTLTKKMGLCLGLTIIPSFAVKMQGEIYVPSSKTMQPITISGFKSFSMLTSFDPTISYALSKKVTVHCAPVFQISIRSLMNESAYYFGTGFRFGMRKYF